MANLANAVVGSKLAVKSVGFDVAHTYIVQRITAKTVFAVADVKTNVDNGISKLVVRKFNKETGAGACNHVAELFVEPVHAIVIHVSPEEMQQAIDEDTPVAPINTVKPREKLSGVKVGDVLVLNRTSREKMFVTSVAGGVAECCADHSFDKAMYYYKIYGAEACFDVETGVELDTSFARTALHIEQQPQESATPKTDGATLGKLRPKHLISNFYNGFTS